MPDQPDTVITSKDTTVITQDDTKIWDFREKFVDKKILVFLYLIVMAAMLGYLRAFEKPSDLVLGFFIGQLGLFAGALANIITGKNNDATHQRVTDKPEAK